MPLSGADPREASTKPRDCIVYLVRHGESAANVAAREFAAGHGGQVPAGCMREDGGGKPFVDYDAACEHFDSPLSTDGWRQVLDLAQRIEHGDVFAAGPPQLVLASPLRRALQTACGALRSLPSLPINAEALLREKLESAADVGTPASGLTRDAGFARVAGLGGLREVWWDAPEDHAGLDAGQMRAHFRSERWAETEHAVAARLRMLTVHLRSQVSDHGVRRVALFGHHDALQVFATLVDPSSEGQLSLANCGVATALLRA